MLTPNFHSSEIICPCGCGDTNIRLATMEKAQWIRDILGVPLFVPEGGGKRCLKYQGTIGEYASAHTSGEAIDLYQKPYSIKNMIRIARLMREAGFLRVGLYPIYYVKSAHGDLWQPAPSASWVRTAKGYIYFKTLDKAIKYVERNYL
jgi:hypothetical protein